MTDYERHLPAVEHTWTIGTVLAASMSLVSLLSVLMGMTWGYARVSNATDAIPAIQADARGDLFHYRAQVDAGMRVARHLSDLIVEMVNRIISYARRGLTAIRQTDL